MRSSNNRRVMLVSLLVHNTGMILVRLCMMRCSNGRAGMWNTQNTQVLHVCSCHTLRVSSWPGRSARPLASWSTAAFMV
jgi:hypothetical protein